MLAAAAVVFSEHGYESATLDQVAAAAGFSKGAVYSNFDDKQHLFLALVRQRVEERLAAVAHDAQPGGTAVDEAERTGLAMANLLETDPEWHRLFLEFWVRAVHDAELQHELAEQRRQLRRLIASAIDKRASELDLHPSVSSDELAVIALALSNGLAIEHLADPATVHPELFATALRLLATGAQSPPEQE